MSTRSCIEMLKPFYINSRNLIGVGTYSFNTKNPHLLSVASRWRYLKFHNNNRLQPPSDSSQPPITGFPNVLADSKFITIQEMLWLWDHRWNVCACVYFCPRRASGREPVVVHSFTPSQARDQRRSSSHENIHSGMASLLSTHPPWCLPHRGGHNAPHPPLLPRFMLQFVLCLRFILDFVTHFHDVIESVHRKECSSCLLLQFSYRRTHVVEWIYSREKGSLPQTNDTFIPHIWYGLSRLSRSV